MNFDEHSINSALNSPMNSIDLKDENIDVIQIPTTFTCIACIGHQDQIVDLRERVETLEKRLKQMENNPVQQPFAIIDPSIFTLSFADKHMGIPVINIMDPYQIRQAPEYVTVPNDEYEQRSGETEINCTETMKVEADLSDNLVNEEEYSDQVQQYDSSSPDNNLNENLQYAYSNNDNIINNNIISQSLNHFSNIVLNNFSQDTFSYISKHIVPEVSSAAIQKCLSTAHSEAHFAGRLAQRLFTKDELSTSNITGRTSIPGRKINKLSEERLERIKQAVCYAYKLSPDSYDTREKWKRCQMSINEVCRRPRRSRVQLSLSPNKYVTTKGIEKKSPKKEPADRQKAVMFFSEYSSSNDLSENRIVPDSLTLNPETVVENLDNIELARLQDSLLVQKLQEQIDVSFINGSSD